MNRLSMHGSNLKEVEFQHFHVSFVEMKTDSQIEMSEVQAQVHLTLNADPSVLHW